MEMKREITYEIKTKRGSRFIAKVISKYCTDEITYGIKVGDAYGALKKSEIDSFIEVK